MKGTTIGLDAACNVEYGTRVVQKRDGGSLYPVYGGGGPTFRMDEFNREGRVVIARFGMSEECTRFVVGKFFLNDSGLTVSPKNGTLLPRFLDYQMLALNDEIYALGRGAAQKNLDVPVFRALPLFVPGDTGDQRRIVGILDKAFAAIAAAKANTEKNLQNARALFEIGSRKLMSPVNNGWTETSLGKLAAFRNGLNYTQHSRGEQIRIVGVKDFQKNFWVPDKDLKTVTIDGKLDETDMLSRGDILVVRSNGNPVLVGRCIVANGIEGKISHSGFTIRIRLSSGDIMPEYLCHFLKQPESKAQLVASGTGTNIRSLNQQGLSKLCIRFPSRSDQDILVKHIEALSDHVHAAEGLYRSKLGALDELRKSVLQQAFAGAL